MMSGKESRSTVEMAVEHGIRNMTEQQIAAVPLQTQGPDSLVLKDARAGSWIMRISAYLHELEGKRKIAEQLLADAMREQFPEMEGKDVVLYQGWQVGSEEPEVRTGDLFRIAESKGRSTRSNDVNIGAIRGASITN